MRAFLLCFIIILNFTAGARPIFESAGLYQWYDSLYAFKNVDLSHPLLSQASPIEKDFATLNYHWWQLLSGGANEDNAMRITEISTRYLNGRIKPATSTDQQLFMAIISSSFEARVQMMESNTLNSVQVYMDAIPYLKVMLKRRHQYDEFGLVASIYEACINEMEGSFLYMPILLLLPESQDKSAFAKLQKANGYNTLCRIESSYFSFKIASGLKDDLELAQTHLDELIRNYPDNLVFRIEKLRLLQKMDKSLTREHHEVKQRILNSKKPEAVKEHFLSQLEKVSV